MSIYCSVIVLNYNGAKIVGETINSLEKLNYPKDRFEVIIVDNHSHDDSKNIIEKYARLYPNIKTIFLDSNLGFSGGNNQGIKKAKGKYVCLLNNDCIVDRNWLKKLLSVARQDRNIFAVNSKILLYPKYLVLDVVLHPDVLPIHATLRRSKILKLFNVDKKSFKFLKKEERCILELPIDPFDKVIEFEMFFNHGSPTRRRKIDVNKLIKLNIQGLELKTVSYRNGEIRYKVKVNPNLNAVRNNTYDKIQNAGIVVFQDGYGRDIGSIVRYKQQFYEYDIGQYNTQKEIYAACGAAVLYRKDILEKIGYLDKSFFMYYEDVEISERARINGYKIVYSPKSVVRHMHALSSKEWSPFFIYHVEKGRLLHILYYFPLRVFFGEYLNMLAVLFINLIVFIFKLRLIIFGIMSDSQEKKQSEFKNKIQIFKVLIFFLFKFIPLWIYKRSNINNKQNTRIISNYNHILEGGWYFK